MSKVVLPRSLAELWTVMKDEPEAAIYSGGTDLLVRRRRGRPGPESALVCLERVPELKGVRVEDGVLRIGAASTHAECLAGLPPEAETLKSALRVLGSPPIRNMGTIGGNVCSASPAGDALPPLHVLGAEVVLRSERGERSLPLEDFILGPGRIDLRPGEILFEIRAPLLRGAVVHHFEKVGQRNSLAIAVVSLAATARMGPGGIVEEARLALGSVGPTVARPREAEEALAGRPLSLKVLREAADLVRASVSPMDDLRATAAYRREVAGNLLLRLATS